MGVSAAVELVFLCLLIGASGCGDPLPEPAFQCVNATHCPDGAICVQGVCTTVEKDIVTVDAGQIDAAADIGDTGPCVPCKAAEDCAFGGACVEAYCEVGCCVANPLPNGTACDDGEKCPAPGKCSLGLCAVSGPKCDDGNACTVDSCGTNGCSHLQFADGSPCNGDALECTIDVCKAGKCESKLRPEHCLIDHTCYAKDAVDPTKPCNRCNPEVFSEGWTGATTGPCDDGDKCTKATNCTDTSDCNGTVIVCNDNNVCTNDSCAKDAGCVHLSNAGTCTDDDPCTLDGSCKDGGCKSGGKTDCDDANPCTADSCIEGFGCVHSPKNDGGCVADTDPCTDDVCKGGNCVAIPSVAVCKIGGTCIAAGGTASGNPCMICSPQLDSKNWTVLDGSPCDDGDKCTTFDTCSQGTCKGTPAKCVDNNQCTADSCDSTNGCTFKAESKPCDDSDKCTKKDFCVAGKCAGTAIPAADCDDSNDCTIDSCAPSYGCTNKPAPLKCDDGDKCTKGDHCVASKCVAGQLVCPCEFDKDCDDKNPCTADSCVLGQGCSNPPLKAGASCNDGDKCTTNDVCGAATCQGKAIDCDDKNTCTKDACVAELGCTHISLHANKCDDGDKCTSGDLCLSGKCGGTPKSCDDGNACTDDSCDPSTAKCVHAAALDGSACPDDNVPCTVDECVKATCKHTTIAKDFCLISGACLSGGALHPAKQCEGCNPLTSVYGWSILAGNGCKDGNGCTTSETCTKAGKCVGKKADCNDGNPCTTDACNPSAPGGDGCINKAIKGSCDDGDKCTKDDTCLGKQCTGAKITCDDSDDCTEDACTTLGGCVFTKKKNGSACASDGLDCTLDGCLDGQCRHQVKAGFCRVDGACIKDSTKHPKQLCLACIAANDPNKWSAISGGTCDDGDTCTGADSCVAGACKGDAAKACDDTNPCTLDTCTQADGCNHKPAAGSCEDGDKCTTKDTCKDGKCEAGTVVQCTNNAKTDACEVTTCLPAKGCVNVTTCGPMHGCVKGLCLTTNGQKAGPVKVPVPGVVAAQPMRPTLRWQESATGPMGSVPRLWIAAQTNECSVAIGNYSKVFTAVLPPSAAAPDYRVLKTPSPTGNLDWCATQPQLAAHPSTYEALVLGWLEGGGKQSGCVAKTHGGQARVALVGLNGADAAMSVAAKCPSGNIVPLAGRPAMSLLTAGPVSNKQDPAQLGGLLVRPGTAGPVVYSGNVVGKWGANGGLLLPTAALTGHVEQVYADRPSLTAWTTGAVVTTVSNFLKSGAKNVPALTATRIDAAGKLAAKGTVVLTGVGLACTSPAYVAAEASYDPDVKRIGVLVSGTCESSNNQRGFLAFARVHPDQAPLPSPKVAIVHDVPKAAATTATIRAFRVAELPGKTHFLAAWVAPGTSVIKLFRIEPSDDSSFKGVDLGSVAGSFSGQGSALPIAASGGLSELVIGPKGERYSLAWEGVGSLYMITAPLTK